MVIMSINKFNSNSKLDVIIQSIDLENPDDLRRMAKVYEDSFSEHFLGHMGRKFLELFISEFVNTSGNYGYVAKFKDEPVGLLLATTLDKPFNKFYKKHFISIARITVSRYFRDQFIRKHLGERLGHINNALKALFFRGNASSSAQAGEVGTLIPPRLLAIAVDNKYRGHSVADELTQQFCLDMKDIGFKKVALSALPWNQRAIGFYKKDGWIEESSSESSIGFYRLI